jgi:hypothetical protein
MIPVEREPKDLIQDFGVYEKCLFCLQPTDTWHTNSDTPVCIHCAQTRFVWELPESRPIKAGADSP